MTTADLAIVVSFVSLLIAISSFVWNIWSKFIYPKPKLRISAFIMKVIGGGFEDAPRAITITVTNHGPISAIVDTAVAKTSDADIGGTFASINPYSNYPYDLNGDGQGAERVLPKKLEVGENLNLYFPIVKEWITKDKVCAIGVKDTFGRFHWVPSKQFVQLRNKILDCE